MEKNNSSSRIHPLVAGAAVSVMLVSLTGVAAITGLIPTSHSGNATASTQMDQPVAGTVGAAHAASSPATLLSEEETPQGTIKSSPTSERQLAPEQRHPRSSGSTGSHARAHTGEGTVARAPTCSSCGRVESVVATQQAAKPSGVGIAAGAIIGGVLGNQVGGGNGRTLATVAGAVGGGYAGNEVEKRTRATTIYQVRVRTEDGRAHTFSYEQQPAWAVGDRVKIVNGALVASA